MCWKFLKEILVNKMNKKLMICILASLMLFTGCEVRDNSTVEKANQEKYGVTDYKDLETGVHYLIYDDDYGSGITVRYNADGTIMVD